MFSFTTAKSRMPDREDALPGRASPIDTAETHFVSGRSLKGPHPPGTRDAMFGMGCFWGVERLFWSMDGVWVTAAGYAAGRTPNPTYQEVCTGLTGHNEVVKVAYDPARIGFNDLLKAFWENHDPTQGMRQGNDIGTQYRSGIYTCGGDQFELASDSRDAYADRIKSAGLGPVTTEIREAPEFYFAEEYHQQYLAKVRGGYCSLRGTGVEFPAVDMEA